MTTLPPRFDAVVHAPPRLQICGLLAAVDTMDFAAVRDEIGVSDSVLSKHVRQLEEAGYVAVRKATRVTCAHDAGADLGGSRRVRRARRGVAAHRGGVIDASPAGRRRRGRVSPVGEDRGRQVLDGLLVVAGASAAAVLFAVLGLPSPALFGGLLAGLVRALAFRRRIAVPTPATTAAQAVVGVSLGVLVDVATLRTVAANWLPVLLVTLATLLLSLLAGLALRRQRGISPVTGAFALIAGGASGIIVMARELGADERMVAVLQYLRVLLIVVLMPVIATGLYGASPSSGPGATGDGAAWPASLLFTVGCGLVGLLAGGLVHLPVPSLLGPMLVAAAVDLGGLSRGAEVPGALGVAAFLVIGLQVGVSFTRESLATIGQALPLALIVIVGLIVACTGLGAVLAATTGVSPLDGYLATTPGGITAVLATATDSGADATFVLAVQVLRLFVMLLTAPLVARWLRRSRHGLP